MAADAADRGAIYPVMSTTAGPTYTLGATTTVSSTFTTPTIVTPTTRVGVLVGASSLTMDATMSGKVIACGAAEDFVLPTITSGNLGMTFKFVVITTATSLTITAAATQLLRGGVSVMSTAVGAENDAFSADGTDDLIITMNGTTQGGIIGSWVELYALSTTAWVVNGGLIGSGTIVTPFS
jgi:hypothetical protein